MSKLAWSALEEAADNDYEEFKDWTPEEIELWQEWNQRWFQYNDSVEDRVSGLKTAERLREIFDARMPYSSLFELEVETYREVCVDLGLIWTEPKPEPEEPPTPQEPPAYAEDDFVIDWSQPVIFRGESRNGDGRLFYLHVPWDIVPGNQLRSFLKENVGVAKGYNGMSGFKLGGVKYVRTLPLMGQVNKKPVSYIDRTIEALLAHGAEKVQERRVVNIEELCTGSCQGANSWTPCECVCGGEGHGGGSVLPGADYTIYRGDLIIEGKRQIVWKVYE